MDHSGLTLVGIVLIRPIARYREGKFPKFVPLKYAARIEIALTTAVGGCRVHFGVSCYGRDP